MNTYLVIAYRWGYLNGCRYEVYCGPDKARAIALAESERDDRGGKYGCAVYEWNEGGTSYKSEPVAYFGGSMHMEEEPFRNWRLDYFKALGHVLDGWASGRMLVPNPEHPKDSMVLAEVDKPPQFLLDEIARQQSMYESIQKFEDKMRKTTKEPV